MPARVAVVSTTQLQTEPVRVCALDAPHGRLLLANKSGLSSIRCPSLIDAGAWLDEACEGYWDLGNHLRSVCCLSVSSNGRFIATVSDHEYRCVVHLVDPFGGRGFSIHKILEHKHPVVAVAYASDGSTLLVATADGHVRGWEIDTEGTVSVSANLVHDHKVVQIRAGACEETGVALVACLCADGSVWLWDTHKWCVLTKIQPRANHLMGVDARERGTGRDRGRGGISTWGDFGMLPDKESDWKGHIGAIVECDVSADGFLMATASRDRTCKVWQLSPVLYESHEQARQALGVGPAVYLARVQLAEDSAGTSASLLVSLTHHAPCVHCKFGRADEEVLVTCSMDASCIGWHIPSGERRFQVSVVGVPGLAPTLLAVHHTRTDAKLPGTARSELQTDESRPTSSQTDPMHIFLSIGCNIIACQVADAAPRNGPAHHSPAMTARGHRAAAATAGRSSREDLPRALGGPRLQGADCPWLVVQRQRLLKQGLALADIPWILATRILTPHALVEALLQGLGMPKKARVLFRQMLVEIDLSKVHFLRQASTCGNLSLLSKLIAMVWSNATQGMRLPTHPSWRPSTWNAPGPIVLLLPPSGTTAGTDQTRDRGALTARGCSNGAPPRLPHGPTTPRGVGGTGGQLTEQQLQGEAGRRVTLVLPAGRGAGGGEFVDVSEVVVDSGMTGAVRFVPWTGMGSKRVSSSHRKRVSGQVLSVATARSMSAHDVDDIRQVPKLDLGFSKGAPRQRSSSPSPDSHALQQAYAPLNLSRAPPGPKPSAPTSARGARSGDSGADVEGSSSVQEARLRDISKMVTCAGSARALLDSIPAFDAGVDESVVSLVHHVSAAPEHRSSSSSPHGSSRSQASASAPPQLDMTLALRTHAGMAAVLKEQGLEYNFISTEDVSGQIPLDDTDDMPAEDEEPEVAKGSGQDDCARAESGGSESREDVEQQPSGTEAEQQPSGADRPGQVDESLDSHGDSEAVETRPRGVSVTINLNMGLERGEGPAVPRSSANAEVRAGYGGTDAGASVGGGELVGGNEERRGGGNYEGAARPIPVTTKSHESKGPALRPLPLHTVPREHEEHRRAVDEASGVEHVVTSAMPLRNASGSILHFPTRTARHRPLSGVKVGGPSTRERADDADMLTARAVNLNRKSHEWPAPVLSAASGTASRAVTTGAAKRLEPKALMTPEGVRGVGVTRGVLRSGDDDANGACVAVASDADKPAAACQDGQNHGGAPAGAAPAEDTLGGSRPLQSEHVPKSRGHGGSSGSKSARMWRGAGEGAWDARAGEQAEKAEQLRAQEGLPRWISFMPLVLITIEPARGEMWEALASSRQAHAQLESWWAGSKGAKPLAPHPPDNEPPQPHSARIMPKGLERGAGPAAKAALDMQRRLADRPMGQQISNVQWRSSLRANASVVALELATPKAPLVATPRLLAAKDNLRNAPASEHSLDIGKGRKLTQSLQCATMLAGAAYPARIMRQNCFLACAGKMSDMDEFGKLVIQGPLRPVPLVHQPLA